MTTYKVLQGLKVIETTPDNIYIQAIKGKALHQIGAFGINGTWQNTKEAHLSRSIWGLAANNNKAIGPNSYTNSPRGHKRGTIVYYEDGTLDVIKANTIKDITKPFKWAIGGGELYPNYNPKAEGIASDILRHTDHTGMAIKRGKVLLIVTEKQCSLKEFSDKVAGLGVDKAIFLDGGGSTQMYWKGGLGHRSNRKLSHGVFLFKG